MRCVLVRHGQTTANELGQLDTGHPGAALTALGRRQAEALPSILDPSAVELIAVSSLRRTWLTAEPLARASGRSPVRLPEFAEVSAGALELLADEQSKITYLETVIAWAGGDLDRLMPGGGDGHEFLGRFDRGMAWLGSRGVAEAVVVSHGAAIRGWSAARVRGVSAEFTAANRLHNTGRVIIDGTPEGGWELVEWIGEPALSGHAADASDDPTGAGLGELRQSTH